MGYRKYTKEEFIESVKSSISIRQCLKKLGLAPKGGNYRTFHRYVKKLSIDISHFKGQGWNKGQNFGPKRPIEDYLSNKFKTSSHSLRKRLVKENYFEHKCYKCNHTRWNNEPIPLELEHKDGDHSNNNLDNLTLLCPNCHAQTSTYRGRNISSQ